jgi:hypothetical protein
MDSLIKPYTEEDLVRDEQAYIQFDKEVTKFYHGLAEKARN